MQTCSVIQAHSPDFYNPPPLDADSVSRVSETYGITMDAALYRLFTPSPHSRRFDTKDIEAPHSRSCAAALCWQERVKWDLSQKAVARDVKAWELHSHVFSFCKSVHFHSSDAEGHDWWTSSVLALCKSLAMCSHGTGKGMVEMGDLVSTQSCKFLLRGPAYMLYSDVKLCGSTRNVFCSRLLQDLKRVFDQHSTQVWLWSIQRLTITPSKFSWICTFTEREFPQNHNPRMQIRKLLWFRIRASAEAPWIHLKNP